MIDVAIIGAGLSGLAAGIRLAYFDRRVCLFEKHYAYGGLNSYYTLDGREFDVGLHALTNYVRPEIRTTPLPRLLRQLRISRDELDLREQRHSEIRFPGRTLRFTNDPALFQEEVGREFPKESDRFQRLLEVIRGHDDFRLDAPYQSARAVLADLLGDPVLMDMLLCPVMYYGSAEEHDMDFSQFVTIYKSVLDEGLARPRGGVRPLLKTLVRKFRAAGGKLRMQRGVRRIEVERGRAIGVTLENGEFVEAGVVFSSAGLPETMKLCPEAANPKAESNVGRLSFVECFALLDRPPADLGHGATIVFFNDAERFTYARPAELVDFRSGVVACPNNYEGHDEADVGVLRMTWLANYDGWSALGGDEYAAAKERSFEDFLDSAERFVPGIRKHIVARDVFTPRTIERFTGHLQGAVYGAPRKVRDGRTNVENLYLCGTDQGYLGVIGAMMSGITMANLHVLVRE